MARRWQPGELPRPRRREGGFTYVGLLVIVVIAGLMLSMASRVWSTTAQRERETQLLFIGHAYRTAIASYFATGHRYPASLEDLVLDQRFPEPKRHLRQLYADPMTGQVDWSLVMTPDGHGIMGVASNSQSKPIKLDGFELIDEAFKDSDCYCNWQFVYYPNRYSRWKGQLTSGAGSDPKGSGSLGTFKPGTLNPLPSSSGALSPRSGQGGNSIGELQQNGSPTTDASSDPTSALN
ncbi:MAG: type II secretion system protein [Sinobacteraceae bacterium]|nr:type II secretion system protein [Nevskiaceae bacterium]